MGRIWLAADYSQAEARVVAWAGPVVELRDLFLRGDDIHLYVCKKIARYVQENKVTMPELPMSLPDGTTVKRRPFSWKPWDEFDAGDPERYTAKRTVHANNYGMGKTKFAIITNLPTATAEIVQSIYFSLFPDVKGRYQHWIDSLLSSKNRTIITPQGFRRIFYDTPGPELSRAGYAFYPQTTVGLLLVDTLATVSEIFVKEKIVDNVPWSDIWHPVALRNAGLNVRLQMHDSIAVAIEDDPSRVRDAATIIKTVGEQPLTIRHPGEVTGSLQIPMDFKTGRTLKERQSFEEDHPDYLHKYNPN